MADDSGSGNKVVFELDVNDENFKTKLAGVTKALGDTGKEGQEGFSKAGFAMLELNAAIEIGEKALELFKKSFESMEFAEKINNQATALKNLGVSLGTDTNDLTKAVNLAFHGTISNVEATKLSFDLLAKKIRADQIPVLAELAHKNELATGKPAIEALEKYADAIDRRVVTGLRNYGVEKEAVGTREQIYNLIVSQGTEKLKMYGDGYDDLAKRMSAKSSNIKDSIFKAFGDVSTGVMATLFGDSADKAMLKISQLEFRLKRLAELSAKGQTVDVDGQIAGYKTIADEKIALEKKIADQRGLVTDATAKELEEQKKLNASLTQQKEIGSILNPQEKKDAELSANVAFYAKMAAMEDESGKHTTMTSQGVYQTQKALIDEHFRFELQNAGGIVQTKEQYAAKVLAIEKKKYDALKKLRVDDTEFAEMRENAELKSIESNNFLIENANQKHVDILIKQENLRFKNEQDAARNSIKDKDALNLKLEQLEAEHQRKLAENKKKMNSASVANFKEGWMGGIAEVEKQNLNFAQIMQKSTVQTHKIMSKSFSDAAKGHGDAVKMMKEQFMDMIGTQMIESGVAMMMVNAFPPLGPNPAALAEGAALIAVGSAISGASGAGASGADSGGGGGGSSYSPQQASQKELERKSAQIIIQGDYMNSRETQTHLAEVLRSNSDITDYAITAQGKAY